MTCKNCIHSEACNFILSRYTDLGGLNPNAACCSNFKDKKDFIDLHSQIFTHICKSDRDLYPTEFSIYARVISEDKDTITIDRFQKFGAIYCGRATFDKEDFEKYYKPIEMRE